VSGSRWPGWAAPLAGCCPRPAWPVFGRLAETVAFTGAHLEIRDIYGPRLRNIPADSKDRVPDLSTVPLDRHGLLSAEVGLPEPLRRVATAAATFAQRKDLGLEAAGAGLVEMASRLDDIDRHGSAAIRRLFPDPAPDPGGAR
jgi:hypothetical protein